MNTIGMVLGGNRQGISALPTHRLLLLLSIVFILLPHIARIPAWISVFCFALVLWRTLFELGDAPDIPRILKIILTISGTIGIFVSFHALVGREAGSALLLLMMCLKLTEMRGERDIFQCLFLGYFVVVVGFLFSQSIWMGLYMLVVIVNITASLIAYAHGGKMKVNLSPFHYLKIASNIILQAFPVAILLFLLFPRLPGPLWSIPEDEYSAKTGLSDTMSPGNISNLTDSYAVAFRAKFEKQPERVNDLYWRGLVLWYYDGRTWSNPNAKINKRYDLAFKVGGERLNYSVTLEPHDKQWLFAVDLPAQIPFDSYVTPEFQLMANEPVNQLMRYSLSSYPQYQLERNNPPAEHFSALPLRVAPRAEKLVMQWKQETTEPAKLVKKALDYFRSEPFYYSRNPPLLTNNPIDEFLFSTRKGFCEHFASSYAVLMRLAGIPARVVMGYHGGEVNPISDYVIVRQSSAHAWVEVWLANSGWVRIDPTSVIPESRVENVDDLSRIQPLSHRVLLANADLSWLSESMRNMGFLWDAVNNRWNQWVIGFNDEKQRDLMEWLGMERAGGYIQVVLMASGIVIVLLLASLVLFRNKKIQLTEVQKLYQRFCRKIAKRGIQRVGSEGAVHFSGRIAQKYPQMSAIANAITDDYYKIRYAGASDPELIHRLRRNVRKI